jgi:hypothetical protein
MPECAKFDLFLLQFTSAYETSRLSQFVIFKGIPFWHPSWIRCKIPCHRCEGVRSFFPLSQLADIGANANPGFFPYGFK